MITWFTWLQVALALAGGLLCLGLGLAGRKPNDFALGAALIVELGLLAQLVIAIAAPINGNLPTGSLGEFYIYLISALILAPVAAFWALIERTRFSTMVIGVACLSVAIMVYRMEQIWTVQVA